MKSQIKADYDVGCVDGYRDLNIVKEFNSKTNKYIFLLWWDATSGDRNKICYLNKKGYFDSFAKAERAMYEYYGKKWVKRTDAR